MWPEYLLLNLMIKWPITMKIRCLSVSAYQLGTYKRKDIFKTPFIGMLAADLLLSG